MDIGRTNKRVTFCRYTEKQNELLQTEKVLEEIKTVWASVEPTRGREYQEAQRIRPELTYKITTRYHKEVTPDMFIKFKDRYFQIVSIINVRERNEMLEIVCTEKLTENPTIVQIKGRLGQRIPILTLMEEGTPQNIFSTLMAGAYDYLEIAKSSEEYRKKIEDIARWNWYLRKYRLKEK